MLGEKRLAVFAITSASFVFCVCLAVITVVSEFQADLRTALPGSIAPEIAVRDVDNQDLTLSGLRGGFVLVYFRPDPTAPSEAAADSSDHSAADASNSNFAPSPINANAADLTALNQLSAALNAKQVTVLESSRPASEQPMKLLSVASRGSNSAGFAGLADDPARANRTLVDADGEIARDFRVDAVSAQATLFVIDADGVIRFRGPFEQVATADLVRQLLPSGGNKQFSLAHPSMPIAMPFESLASLNRF